MPSPRSGLLNTGSYNLPPDAYQPATFLSPQTYLAHGSQTSPAPHSAPLVPPGSYQQTGFHHDATEAMPSLPGNSTGLFPGYQQQFPGIVAPGVYAGGEQIATQSFPGEYSVQTGNYGGPRPMQSPSGTGQGYNYSIQAGHFPVPPQKQNNQAIIIVCITLVVILSGIVGITTFALVNRPTTNQTVAQPLMGPTTVPTIASNPSPTLVPTPSPTLPPPTPAADPGFMWCDTTCNQYNFTTEFPVGWQSGPAANGQGVQFSNLAMQNVYASFKALGPTGSAADDVLMNDLQTTFSSQPGYLPPPPPAAANATLGGAPWYAVATSYNDNENQPVHVEVYATIYQGNAYIIELQAPDVNNQFTTVKQQFFVNMLVKFQFLPAAQ